MKKFISNKYVLYTLGLLIFLLIWFVISLFIKDNTMIFPSPIQTINEMIKILSNQYIYISLASTLIRMLIGFVISLLFALIFGTIAGNNEHIYNVLKPTIIALKSIPTASLLFLFLVFVGARNATVFIVLLISFPILYESVVGGYSNIDKGILDSLKLEGENKLYNIVKVKLPLTLPYIFVGIASSFGLSFKIQIMAEILTGDTRSGLGSLILAAQRNDPTNMIPIFAYSLIAIIIVLLIDLLMNLIKNKIKNAKSI